MKTRAATVRRLVPHTIDGITEMIEDDYEIHVPVPARDWDQLVLRAVTAAAVTMVTVSVAWSTASIGDLLGRAVPAPVAYGAASAFDLAWITCMAVEWLARYDPGEARRPRIAGHVALVIAMAAVAVHGTLIASVWVGLVGALVSALAKGMWTLTLRHSVVPLDERTQKWLAQRRSALGGRLALTAAQRALHRTEALLAAEAAALAVTEHRAAVDPTQPCSDEAALAVEPRQPEPAPPLAAPVMRSDADDAHHDAPPVSPAPATPAPVSKTAAILAAASALPSGASPADIAHHLARQGLAVDTAYVRTILSRAAKRAAKQKQPDPDPDPGPDPFLGREGYL